MASEVMKVALSSGITNTEKVLLTVASGHTYTVLNISLCETAGVAETFDLFIQDDGGATDYEIYSDQALAANETFEHTGRIVLTDEDHLTAKCGSTAVVHVVVSYLDQTR